MLCDKYNTNEYYEAQRIVATNDTYLYKDPNFKNKSNIIFVWKYKNILVWFFNSLFFYNRTITFKKVFKRV